jgi:surfeit locus 1 family protein
MPLHNTSAIGEGARLNNRSSIQSLPVGTTHRAHSPLLQTVLPRITSIRQLRFRPTLVPTIAALIVVALTLHLANWQKGRAAEKRGLQAVLDQRTTLTPLDLNRTVADHDALYRRATARGQFLADKQFFVDNKFDGNTVGYHVIAPMVLADAKRVVLVNRGFVARGPAYPAPPVVNVPASSTEVLGLLTRPTSKFIELGSAQTTQGSVWQNLTIERYQQQSSGDVVPYVLIADEPAPGSRPVREQPDAKVEKHVEYMLTWYSLAAAVTILWLVLNTRIKRDENAPDVN